MKFKASLQALALLLLACMGSANAAVIELGNNVDTTFCGDGVVIGDNSTATCTTSLGSVVLVGSNGTVRNNGTGVGNRVNAGRGVAVGDGASNTNSDPFAGAGELRQVSIGYNSATTNSDSVAINGRAQGINSVSINGTTNGNYSTNINGFNQGSNSTVVGGYSGGWANVVIGRGASSGSGPFGPGYVELTTVVGTGARVDDRNSAAVGAFSNSEGRENVLSVGNSQPVAANPALGLPAAPQTYRQIINVAAGTEDHDAVIVQQVVPAITSITNSLGGGATYNPATGATTGPTYNLSTGTYTNVGDALLAIDNKPTGPGGTDPYFKGQGDGLGGDAANASAQNTAAAGPRAAATAYGATAAGAMTNAGGEASSVLGHQGNAEADGSTVLGAYGHATARCTTVGYGAECNEDNTVSFGRAGEIDQRLTHVADGQANTDAANMGQVRTVDARVSQTQVVVANQAAWLGGGANYDPATGAFSGPNYNFLSGAVHTTVGSALADLDGRVAALEALPPGGNGPAGPQGPSGPQGPQGPAGQDGSDGEDGADGRDGRDGAGKPIEGGSNIAVTEDADGNQTVELNDNVELSNQGSVKVGDTTVDANGVSIQGGPSMTRQGIDAGSQRITNVANGRIERGSMDAVNGGQLWDMEQRWNDRWTNIDNRFNSQDKRISGVCAMGAAQAQAIGAAAANGARRKASAGIGYCGGQAAMSANLSWDATTPSGSVASFSIGVSSTGDDTSIGGGVSIGW